MVARLYKFKRATILAGDSNCLPLDWRWSRVNSAVYQNLHLLSFFFLLSIEQLTSLFLKSAYVEKRLVEWKALGLALGLGSLLRRGTNETRKK